MKARNAVRDQGKLCAWEDYVRATDFRVPHELEDTKSVDRLFVFDNENEQTARASLSKMLSEWDADTEQVWAQDLTEDKNNFD